MGPKRSTRKGKKEYMRSRKLLMEAARAKKKEDSVRDNRWERLHSAPSGDRLCSSLGERNALIKFIFKF